MSDRLKSDVTVHCRIISCNNDINLGFLPNEFASALPIKPDIHEVSLLSSSIDGSVAVYSMRSSLDSYFVRLQNS